MAVVPIAKPLEFEIGSPEDEDGRDSDERIHGCCFDRSFAIATREVTLAQFRALSRGRPRRIALPLCTLQRTLPEHLVRFSASTGLARSPIATG